MLGRLNGKVDNNLHFQKSLGFIIQCHGFPSTNHWELLVVDQLTSVDIYHKRINE